MKRYNRSRATAPIFTARKVCLRLGLAWVACLLTVRAGAGDWPQFRYDAGRTAAATHELAAEVELRWTRTFGPPRPAFPHEPRLAYDASYEPVVLGRMIFVPSMVTDSVTALDTETGDERWQFFAEGPVRFAPVAWNDKVYFVSDDGYLYCLDAADGRLRWKFRGLPEGRRDRRLLGNGRLISLWPARGGPVLADGVVYFAAGLWPTEGVFIHAVDAESGKALWSNTDSDLIPRSNWDHGAGVDSGLTPQGYLAVVGDWLVVPCGAQLPAFLDLQTGRRHTYTFGWGGRVGQPKGAWFVAGVGKYLIQGGDLYDITRPYEERDARSAYERWLYPGGWTRLEADPANQKDLGPFRQPVLTDTVMYESGGEGIRIDPATFTWPDAVVYKSGGEGIVARDLTSVALRERSQIEVPAHRRRDVQPDTFIAALEQLWQLPSELQLHIKAGRTLYAGGPGVVAAIDTAADPGPQVVWQAEIEGTPHRMLAAAGKLFVVTAEGDILAFGAPREGGAIRHDPAGAVASAANNAADKWTAKAAAILEATGIDDGYALVLGIEHGRLVEELARQSNLHLIAVDTDAGKVAALRRRLHRAGLYAARASVLVGDGLTYPLPPYLASLIVSEDPRGLWRQAEGRAVAEAIFRTLRPLGGVVCTWGVEPEPIEAMLEDEAFAGATVQRSGPFVLAARAGPLPQTADWSHAEANAAGTGASDDEFLAPPLAPLWFDSSQRWHKDVGHLEARVAGGRLIVLEAGLLRAVDVYTGRALWERELPVAMDEPIADRTARWETHRAWGLHRGLALAPTTQLVALDDAIYVADGRTALVFDAATGQPAGGIELPEDVEAPERDVPLWDEYKGPVDPTEGSF